MTDITEIRKAYVEYSAAQTAYWDDLAERAADIHRGLAKHLGVTGQTFMQNGQRTPYVEIGTFTGGVFEPARPPSLDGEDLEIPFALKVTVDEGPECFPKEHFVLELSIKRAGGFYSVNMKINQGNVRVNIPCSFSEKSQAELYEQMARHIMDSLNPAIFG